MKLAAKTLLIIMLLTPFSSVCAQQPRLKGKVDYEDPQERGSEITIKVKNVGTGGLVSGQQESTKVEDWYHVAPINALVDVEFDGGGCYMGDGHSRIRVRQENADLRKVVLQKTRECKLKELAQQVKQQTISASAAKKDEASTAPRATGRVASTQAIAEARAKEFEIYSVAASDLIPSPEELKRELEAEAAHARNGEFFDTFQYKFALKTELYRSRPALMKVLTDFRAKTENSLFFRAIGQVRPEMYDDIVRRELQPSRDVNLDNIVTVVKEDAVTTNIRGTATVALLNGEIPDDKLGPVREYFRQQSPSSPIFQTSLIALLRVGEAEDQARLFGYVRDGSAETRNIAMEALSLATLIKGVEAFPDGSTTLATVAANKEGDPLVRAVAFRSLRPFVDQGDKIALQALVNGLTDQNKEVRMQVVLALGVGKTEQDPRVRDRLRRIMLSDGSYQVREAARLSLSGAQTTDWFSPKLPKTMPY
jgi:HEAT repeat protein